MGCLPVPIFFLVGAGVGYLIDRQAGAVWGAGIGLLAGFVGMAILLRALRSRG